MAWGLALPGRFGEFFPDGEYVGWDEVLAEYFDNEMAAEQKALFDRPGHSSYAFHVAEKFTSEPGLKRSGYPPFGPIAVHEAPKRFETDKKYTSLGSLIQLNDRLLAVDGLLKVIIERFEPDIHHFFPIEIGMPKKVVYPTKYFVMAIGRYINSFLTQQSEPTSWRHDFGEYNIVEETKKGMAGLALSRSTFGNAHLWRESRVSNELLCFSDQLMAEINRSGLRLPKNYKLKVA